MLLTEQGVEVFENFVIPREHSFIVRPKNPQ